MFRKQKLIDAKYQLRPETIESVYIAWKLTGDPKYREIGWSMFQAIQTYAKIPNDLGYATVINVDQVPVELEDRMETFVSQTIELEADCSSTIQFVSETLKYLLLLFSDISVLPFEGQYTQHSTKLSA